MAKYGNATGAIGRQGRSPYDAKVCQDAETKASNTGIRYFFTWNVNTFVLWDRRLYARPLLERRS